MKFMMEIELRLSSTVEAISSTGRIAARRVVMSGGSGQDYAAGWGDACAALALALGLNVDNLGDVPLPLTSSAPKTLSTASGRSMPAMSQAEDHAAPRVPTAEAKERADKSSLTPTERGVAQLLAQGHTNKEIGAKLTIERNTVKTHIHNIYKKLGVHDRSEFLDRWAALNAAGQPASVTSAGTPSRD